jgi:hypothetical protein
MIFGNRSNGAGILELYFCQAGMYLDHRIGWESVPSHKKFTPERFNGDPA